MMGFWEDEDGGWVKVYQCQRSIWVVHPDDRGPFIGTLSPAGDFALWEDEGGVRCAEIDLTEGTASIDGTATWKKLEDVEDGHGSLVLGARFLAGEGLPVDDDLGTAWLKAAAGLGEPQAVGMLGAQAEVTQTIPALAGPWEADDGDRCQIFQCGFHLLLRRPGSDRAHRGACAPNGRTLAWREAPEKEDEAPVDRSGKYVKTKGVITWDDAGTWTRMPAEIGAAQAFAIGRAYFDMHFAEGRRMGIAWLREAADLGSEEAQALLADEAAPAR